MFKALKGYLRVNGGGGFIRAASRLIVAALLGLLLPLMACAYTLVLKGGKRIEIPEKFTVTQLSLTYETAPGVNVTVLMSSVDVGATERANNEPPGSLLGRIGKSEVHPTGVGARAPRRALTQANVEAGRRARAESEQAYERRRKELGLPTLEESRRRTEEETKRLGEASLQSRAEALESENYWRARAGSLRTEIAALDAQINYVRARLAEMPEYPTALGAYTFITGPVFPFRLPANRFPVAVGNPGFMHTPGGTLAQPGAGFAAFGGTGMQSQIQINIGGPRGTFHRPRIIGPGVIAPPGILVGLPSTGYDYSYERANLISRLQELEAQRAGLQARWRLLEDEARRAGAQPGWLRP